MSQRDSDPISLAEAIGALRDGLTEAMAEGADRDMQFGLEEPIELELQAVITNEGSAGVKWHIYEAGGSHQRAHTQVVRLKLTPYWRNLAGDFTRTRPDSRIRCEARASARPPRTWCSAGRTPPWGSSATARW